MRRRTRQRRARGAGRAAVAAPAQAARRAAERVPGQGRPRRRSSSSPRPATTSARAAAATRSRSTPPRGQAGALRDGGITAKARRHASARRRRRRRRRRIGDDSGYDVWTRYDAVADDGKEQYDGAVRPARRRARSSSGSRSARRYHGRDIWALKVTKDAKTTADNTRPAVLYNAMQHAREWLAGETCRRTLDFFVDNYGRRARDDHDGDPIPNVPAEASPSWSTRASCGSSASRTRTATTSRSPPGNRLWRKNLRDNDNDGDDHELGDGVDPNRNFATNWGLDEEGASDNPASETYRGPGAGLRARDPGDEDACGTWSTSRSRRTTTPRRSCCCGRRASSSTRRRRTTRSSRRSPATTPTRRSPTRCGRRERGAGTSRATASTRTSPSELYITNGDTLDDGYRTTASSASRPRARSRPTRTSAASSSRTTRTRSRRSSAATCCSRSTSPSPRPTRGTRARTWATACRLLRRPVQASPTATRSPSRRRSSARSATS